jgi:hypothetical protein
MSTLLFTAALIAITLGLAPAAVAGEDWKFGAGTGFFGLNIDGDGGVATVAGPLEFDASMDFDEIKEVLESAFGVGGFAAKGKWTITYNVQRMELEDTVSGVVLATPASATLTFTGTGAEGTVSYRFAVTGKTAWSLLTGLRYTKHDYDLNITVGAAAPFFRGVDHDWTDFLIGLKHATQLSDKWSWSSRLDGGFGGSEGTFFFNTGFNRTFGKRWMFNIFGQITAVDFEEDSINSSDWYLYDADEFGLGANVLVTW